MKKLVQMLLCGVLATNSTYAYTNKTFLTPRPQGVNLAMESTAGWYELINRNAPERFGGHLQAIVFYQDATDDAKMGRYFGTKDHCRVSLGSVNIVANPEEHVTAQDVDILYLIHDYNNTTVTSEGEQTTVRMTPEQTVYGVYLNYYQNLDTLVKGLYLNVVIPIVRVKNETNLIVAGTQAENVRNFFAGKYQVSQVLDAEGDPTVSNAQDPLKRALITGCASTETGVADIDLMLGYQVWIKQYAQASINIGLTIPTGNEPKGIHLFEALVGNGTHYGFGAGADLWARLVGDLDHNLKFFFKFNYRYLFDAMETRTLGIKNRCWGHYNLLGCAEKGSNNRAIPAANILTQRVEVRPGNQLDLITGLSYNNNQLSCDIGYNFYFREQEAVTLKNCLDCNTYGVLARNHNFARPTGGTPNAANPTGNFLGTLREQIDQGGSALTTDDIDTIAAETPRQLTHKVYFGLGFRTETWEVPVLLGLGVHAEFAARNSAFDTWGIHGKGGFKF